MQRIARGITSAELREGVASASFMPDSRIDYRPALCRFEDDLFATFTAGHEIVSYPEAVRMIGAVFGAVGRAAPDLELVSGFDDPKIGGFADVANHMIKIETGYLYRFLILHECAHILIPEDKMHGPAFTYVLQLLYRAFVGIPVHAMQQFLARHRLPALTALPRIDPLPIAV
jgi:hypothetical protein